MRAAPSTRELLMAVPGDILGSPLAHSLPLVAGELARPLAHHGGFVISAGRFIAHAQALAAELPEGDAVVNLCEDRYAFLLGFAAALIAGRTTLLPPSRAPQAVAEILARHPGVVALSDRALDPPPPSLFVARAFARPAPTFAPCNDAPRIAAALTAVIGYTSGSTGLPRAQGKTWGALNASNAGNQALFEAALGPRFNILATVPPQHMYGLELSVLLPLLGNAAVDGGRPFLPADIAAALAALPAPRLLVATPVHLRALLDAGVALPCEAITSATAPLDPRLAAAIETASGAPLLEVFGSTETCVFAARRPAHDILWAPYRGVRVHPQPDGMRVEAPQLAEPVILADLIELAADGRFRLAGRAVDLIEIAGKRASLGDLTQRLLAIPGVTDAAVVQLERADAAGVRRIAAAVVAPGLDTATILAALRAVVDPVFLPRPLRRVDALPRSATGKLPRAALLELLGS